MIEGLRYYGVPALLGAVAGATAGEKQDTSTRVLMVLGAAAGAAAIAHVVRPAPLPPKRELTPHLAIARDAIHEAEADTFGNVMAICLLGPITYWSSTRADHPVLALALAGGGIAMMYDAAQNVLDARSLRTRFDAAATEHLRGRRLG